MRWRPALAAVPAAFIGLADNRDFAKVAGRLCIGRAAVTESGAYYAYFYPGYVRSQIYCWDSTIPTSELLLAGASSLVQQRLGEPTSFDIRWLGAVHALLFLAAWCLWLRAFRPLQGAYWWIVGLAALWIFGDVGFVSYLNTFYTDAAGLLGAMILLPSFLWLISAVERPIVPAICFTLGSLLFVTSKGLHAALAPVLVVALVAAVWRDRKISRTLTVAFGLALIAGSGWVFLEIPYWYQAQARFNFVFARLLPASPSPSSDLSELGLSQSDLPLIGQHAFLPYSPAFDPVWLKAFAHRGGLGRQAIFFLRHPLRTGRILYLVLEKEAWQRRPAEFSNYQPEPGRPPGMQTPHFGSWSALSTRLLKQWPLHLALWYVAALLIGPILAMKSTPPPAFSPCISVDRDVRRDPRAQRVSTRISF